MQTDNKRNLTLSDLEKIAPDEFMVLMKKLSEMDNAYVSIEVNTTFNIDIKEQLPENSNVVE